MLAFQSLRTGQAIADPSGGSTTVNLDSPGLTEKVCTPLTVPRVSFSPYGDRPGSLTPAGAFEIAAGNGGAYLERCGSHLHEFLTAGVLSRSAAPSESTAGCASLACPPDANAHAIIWEAPAGRLSGIFLPSRQRFSIPVPARVDPSLGIGADYQLALTTTTLYLNVGARPGHRGIWTIPAPTPPPTISTTSLTGLASAKPRLSLTAATTPYAPRIRSITILLPSGLSFTNNQKLLNRAVTASGATLRGLKRSRGQLAVTFRNSTAKTTVSIGPAGMVEGKQLFATAQRGRASKLRMSVTVTDVDRTQTTSPLSFSIK